LGSAIPLYERDEVIETPESGDDDLTLGGRIGLVEAGEEPAAGIEVGRDLLWQLPRRGGVQPFQQACFEVLNHRDLPNMLARRELQGTADLLEAFDELGAIKAHSSSRSCEKQPRASSCPP
jgi:hypothetical protein